MAALGARLKKERERQGITLEQVSEATKITVRMLQALEEERFDKLPGGIFNKGFVRAYARHLKIDEQQAIADYLAASGPVPAPVEKEPELAAIATQKAKTRKLRPGGAERIPWGPLALALLIIAFGFAMWGSYFRQAGGHPAGARAKSRIAPSSSARTTSPGSIVPQTASARDTAPEGTAAGSFVVLIKAHDDCWLDVSADGKDVMHDILAQGQEKSITAHDEVVAKAGNAGGLDLWFNGNKLPAAGEPEEVKTLVFDAHGLRPEQAQLQPAPQSQPRP